MCFHPQESHSVSFESYAETLKEMLGAETPRTVGRAFPTALIDARNIFGQAFLITQRVTSTDLQK